MNRALTDGKYRMTSEKLSSSSLVFKFEDDLSQHQQHQTYQRNRNNQVNHSKSYNHGQIHIQQQQIIPVNENHSNGNNSNDPISLTRAVYDLLRQRERMYEEAVQKKQDMRYELEASALDIERTMLQCRIEMDALKLAAQSKYSTQNMFQSKTENYIDVTFDEQQVENFQQQLESVKYQRDRIMVNHRSSELLATHCQQLSKLDGTVAAMAGVLKATRENLESMIDLRDATIAVLERTVEGLQRDLADSRADVDRLTDAQKASLLEKIHLTDETNKLRSQVALQEVQASESLNISSTQNERERHEAARLEAALESSRGDLQRSVIELEQRKSQARLDARQRENERAINDDLGKEKATLSHALEASRAELEVLSRSLEQTKHEMAVQVQSLTDQLHEAKSGEETHRSRIREQSDEICGAKEALRKALETIEHDRLAATDLQAAAGGEVGELKERVAYLRGQLETAESKRTAQRDEIDDIGRAHRTAVGDLEDQVHRLQSSLRFAQEQEQRLLPAQQRTDELTQEVLSLTHEHKALIAENGQLKAENTRLAHRHTAIEIEHSASHQTPAAAQRLTEESIKQLEADLAAAKAEAAECRLDRDRIKVSPSSLSPLLFPSPRLMCT